MGAPPVAANLTRPPKAALVLLKTKASQNLLETELSAVFESILVFRPLLAKNPLIPPVELNLLLIAS